MTHLSTETKIAPVNNHRQLLPPQRQRQGSALIIVLLLLAMIGTLILSNAVTLRRLKVELQLVEQRQKARWAERPVPRTPDTP